MFDSPHRRLNPLTGDWVLVSPHRGRRPWLGQVEKMPAENLPEYDPGCFLCPGNERAGGIKNPSFTGTFVFDNDFASLLPEAVPESPASVHPLLNFKQERGLCRVVCFSPRHDLTLPELDLPAIENVLSTWSEQTAELGTKDFIRNVQIFENKGRSWVVPTRIHTARSGPSLNCQMKFPKSLGPRRPTSRSISISCSLII